MVPRQQKQEDPRGRGREANRFQGNLEGPDDEDGDGIEDDDGGQDDDDDDDVKNWEIYNG